MSEGEKGETNDYFPGVTDFGTCPVVEKIGRREGRTQADLVVFKLKSHV